MLPNDEPSQSELTSIQEQFNIIIDNSSDAIICKDSHGIILAWNLAATKLFGWTQEEMLGQSITKIVPSELLPEEFKILETINSDKSVELLRTIRLHKDGRKLKVEATMRPLHNHAGRVIEAVKIVRPVAVLSRQYLSWLLAACMVAAVLWQANILKQAQTEQADAKSMLELAQRGSQAGMWCWTPSDPTKTLTEQPDSYVWYGFLFKSMLGYSDDTFPPRLDSFLNIVHPDDLQVVDAAMQEVLRGRVRVPFLTEYRLRHADGSYHWYAAKGAANLNGNDIYQMAGSITPLDKDKVERQLLHALFDAAPLALVVCDDERRIIVFNTAAERLSGYTHRDALGKSAEDLLIVDEADGSMLKVNVSLYSVAYGDRLAFLAYISEAK